MSIVCERGVTCCNVHAQEASDTWLLLHSSRQGALLPQEVPKGTLRQRVTDHTVACFAMVWHRLAQLPLFGAALP